MKRTSKSFHPVCENSRHLAGATLGDKDGSYSRNQASPFHQWRKLSELAKNLKLSRPTVRKALKAETEPMYQRQVQPQPKLGDFKELLTDWLETDGKLPKRQRRNGYLNVYKSKVIWVSM